MQNPARSYPTHPGHRPAGKHLARLIHPSHRPVRQSQGHQPRDRLQRGVQSRLPVEIRLVSHRAACRKPTAAHRRTPSAELTRLPHLQVGCFTIFLAIVQLILFLQVFRNPLVNPPVTSFRLASAPNQPLLERADPADPPYSSEGEEEPYSENEWESQQAATVGRRASLSRGEVGLGGGDGRTRFEGGGTQGARFEAFELGRMGSTGRSRSRSRSRGRA